MVCVRMERRRSFKERFPIGQQSPISIAVERFDQPMVLMLLHLTEVCPQRFTDTTRNVLPLPPEREHQHVHVARGAGQSTQPRELG